MKSTSHDVKINPRNKFMLLILSLDFPNPFSKETITKVVVTEIQQFVFRYSLPLCLGGTSK